MTWQQVMQDDFSKPKSARLKKSSEIAMELVNGDCVGMRRKTRKKLNDQTYWRQRLDEIDEQISDARLLRDQIEADDLTTREPIEAELDKIDEQDRAAIRLRQPANPQRSQRRRQLLSE